MNQTDLPQYSISSLSTVYFSIPVAATGNNGLPVNPTADPVYFAFKAVGVDPASGDWDTGSWDTYLPPASKYVAKILIGPGASVNPGAGTWIAWLKITDSPEVPVFEVAELTLT